MDDNSTHKSYEERSIEIMLKQMQLIYECSVAKSSFDPYMTLADLSEAMAALGKEISRCLRAIAFM